ncbi:iron chaperone [Kribbella sp. NPDC004875]|uniref:iron chaperone n=1 Tax=Kribbella sp. NPDC004875 TaxID=3364107 RepID=UPI0036972917
MATTKKTAATKTAAKKTTAKKASYDGFTDAERDAMKEHAKELKSTDDPADVQAAKIASMADPDRVMAERLNELIPQIAPELTPKTWYGMPGWAKDGKIVCYFQDAAKFKAPYATFGFNPPANLTDGDFWPVAFALLDLTPAVEKQIIALVKKAVS